MLKKMLLIENQIVDIYKSVYSSTEPEIQKND